LFQDSVLPCEVIKTSRFFLLGNKGDRIATVLLIRTNIPGVHIGASMIARTLKKNMVVEPRISSPIILAHL
jgi:hypothetical protein